jgi:hypothetical protein
LFQHKENIEAFSHQRKCLKTTKFYCDKIGQQTSKK